MSTLGYALLSLLARGPATGYELTRLMKTPIGHFWVAQHSQIYPELARLAEIGHVVVREDAGPGPRAKKTYTITESGREALTRWLPQPPAVVPRSEIGLKAYAVRSADAGEMAALYEAIAAEAAGKVAAYRQELDQMSDDPDDPRFGNYAVLKLGVVSHQGMCEWATWLATRLRQVGSPT